MQLAASIDQIRLLLIDDHALFREGISRLLGSEPDLRVVASCGTIAAGRDVLGSNRIDLILLDFDLGAEEPLEFISEVNSLPHPPKILILTAGVEERDALELIQAGVSGIFHKHNEPQMLSDRVRAVMRGELHLETTYLKPLFQFTRPNAQSNRPQFTDRERSVLSALLEGLSNKVIADRLSVSEASVKGILQQLFQKTGVRTRSQLVRMVLQEYKDLL